MTIIHPRRALFGLAGLMSRHTVHFQVGILSYSRTQCPAPNKVFVGNLLQNRTNPNDFSQFTAGCLRTITINLTEFDRPRDRYADLGKQIIVESLAPLMNRVVDRRVE